MSSQSLRARVDEALSNDASSEYGDEFSKEILNNLQLTYNRYQQLFQRVVLLVAIFILLTSSTITQVEVSGIRLQDFNLINKILPALVAYTYYQMIAIVTWRSMLRDLHAALSERLHKAFFDTALCFYELPPSVSIAEAEVSARRKGIVGKLIALVKTLNVLIVILFALGFTIYAYVWLFRIYGLDDVLTWTSLAVSILLFVQALLVGTSYQR